MAASSRCVRGFRNQVPLAESAGKARMRWCTTSSAAINKGIATRNLTCTSTSSRNGTATSAAQQPAPQGRQHQQRQPREQRDQDDAPPLQHQRVVGQVRPTQQLVERPAEDQREIRRIRGQALGGRSTAFALGLLRRLMGESVRARDGARRRAAEPLRVRDARQREILRQLVVVGQDPVEQVELLAQRRVTLGRQRARPGSPASRACRRGICTLPAPQARISLHEMCTKSSQFGVRRMTRTRPAASRIASSCSCRRPTKRSRRWIWSIASTAVVGSLMAGDSALSAMSTRIRKANVGSCSIVRSCRTPLARAASRSSMPRRRRTGGTAARPRPRSRRPAARTRRGHRARRASSHERLRPLPPARSAIGPPGARRGRGGEPRRICAAPSPAPRRPPRPGRPHG